MKKIAVNARTGGKVFDVAFFVIVGSLYAWALAESVLAATVLEIPALDMLLYCAVFVLLLNLMFFNKYTTIGALSFLALGIGILFVFLYSHEFYVDWFVGLRESITDFITFARNQGPYREEFSGIAGWGIAFLFAFVTVLNTRLHFGFFSLTLMALGVIAMPIHMSWGRSDSAIVVMLFCILALLAKRLYLNTLRIQSEQIGHSSRYAIMLLPLCLLIFGVGWVLPKPDAETVENMNLPDVAGAMDTLLHAFSPEQTMSFTTDGQRLGGPAQLNDLVVMVVEAQERVYLTGAVRDFYTGYSWLSSASTGYRVYPDERGVFATDPNPEGLRIAHYHYRRLLDKPIRRITITTMDVRTDTVFTPPFHQTLEFEQPLPITQNSYGNLRAGRVLPREFSYTQNYISWDLESEQLSEILRGVGPQIEQADRLISAGQNFHAPLYAIGLVGVAPSLGGRGRGLTAAELEPFLQLPPALPARVGELALEVTAGIDTNYDQLRALEGFLRSFPYTLDAAELPEGEDFVDHFLFTAQKGYCVHYASAMVVMARTLGIPTRFVEGFIMPEHPAGDGRYWVTNRQAHAWVEAYFENFGWIMFEPTATQYLDLGTFMEGQFTYAPMMEEFFPFDFWDDWEMDPYFWETLPSPELPESLTGEGAASTSEPSPWTLPIIAVALAGVLAFGIRRLIMRYRSRKEELEGLPNREAVLALFAATLSAAGACGKPISPGETALVYADRTSTDPVFFGQGVDIIGLAGLYSKAAYSAHEITETERASARAARDATLSQLKASPKSLPRYLVEKYILLRY